jgi:hypothetical protein
MTYYNINSQEVKILKNIFYLMSNIIYIICVFCLYLLRFYISDKNYIFYIMIGLCILINTFAIVIQNIIWHDVQRELKFRYERK